MFTGTQNAVALALSAVSLSVFATPATHLLVAPDCLITTSGVTTTVLAHDAPLTLILADDNTLSQLSDAKHQHKKLCGGFIDVSDQWQRYQGNKTSQKNYQAFLKNFVTPMKKSLSHATYTIRYEKEANQLLSQLNPDLMWSSLTVFSSNKDRYANSEDGVAAANWIKTQMETMAAGRSDVTVYTIPTRKYKQPSVVVKIGSGNEAGVVVGAHMDTTSSFMENKPGADDDGSGSMTVMETARTILASEMRFKKPVYFVWYAAEEGGLVGSQSVVAEFKKKNIAVDAVMHFDMTGFAYKNQKTIWIIDDYVDDSLTAFLEKIITTYTKRDVEYTRCGYACSDHASWSQAGYAAVIPAEARFEDTNPVMHSSRDTIDKLNKEHMTDYAKIATAFVVELAEPVK
jgi:leucyl aminopeptidase